MAAAGAIALTAAGSAGMADRAAVPGRVAWTGDAARPRPAGPPAAAGWNGRRRRCR